MWLSLIILVGKKNKNLWICADFLNLNVTTNNDIHLLLFIDEILNIVVGNETYRFLEDVSQYHQISIALKDWYNCFCHQLGNLCMDSYAFWCKKWSTNLLMNYQQNQFMKIFLNAFIVFSNMICILINYDFFFWSIGKMALALIEKIVHI